MRRRELTGRLGKPTATMTPKWSLLEPLLEPLKTTYFQELFSKAA
jgi:hypothetical protein